VTEAEWLQCADPAPMLEALRGRATERKVRLFLVACCRRLFPLLPDSYTRKAVKTAERYADGGATAEKLRFAEGSARRSAGAYERELRKGGQREATARDFALGLVGLTVDLDPTRLIWRYQPVYWFLSMAKQIGVDPALEANEPGFLRCVFGNLCRSVTLASSWLTPTVASLAQAAYEERALPSGHLDSARLIILADAVEEAGCTEPSILDHLRSPGPHVRGCFALDQILGKG
jgi:hypothetical protein